MVTTLTKESLKSLEEVRTWFDSSLGQSVMRIEESILDELLSGFFGYHLIQTSVLSQALFNASPIQNKILLGLDVSDRSPVVANSTELPFLDNSIDVIVSHHLLEFLDSPLDTLRELARVSLPMGHFVVIGFNPISFWGLWKSVAKWNGKPPWFGKFIRPGRLMDWLNALNFKIERVQYCIYGPPLSPKSLRINDSSQELSRNINLPCGAVYVVVARKQESTMTSIMRPWRSRGLRLIQGGRLNPATPPLSSGGILNGRK